MEAPIEKSDDKWLRDFIAGAVEEVKEGESARSAAVLPPAWMDLIEGMSAGKSIGPYRISERLGRGGMGVVFKGFDPTLRRVVAIKFLSPRLAVSAIARLRFTREAQAAAAINHPNVVTVHAIGEHEGLPYLVMEYVAGITLAHRLKDAGLLELRSILRIGIQMARGLSAAHFPGPDPSRHQAGEHPARERDRSGQDHRLRSRVHHRRAVAPDGQRRAARYAGLHVARTGVRERSRLPLGPLQPGERSL